MQTIPIRDDTVRRTIAVLSTVAHLQCATVAQIHALCFPFHTLATVRLTLRYLAEAHFVDHTRWVYRQACQGQVWILTAKGHRLLQRYASSVPPLACIDLQRPETAREQEEWRVRHLIRRLIVGLLLEARQYPLLHSIDIQLLQPAGWLPSSNQTVASEPEGCLRIGWRPSERKSADWLPWLDSRDDGVQATEYPIYVDRSYAHIKLQGLLADQTRSQAHRRLIPIFVLADEQRCLFLQQYANNLAPRPRFRMASWFAREEQVSSASWMNVTGSWQLLVIRVRRPSVRQEMMPTSLSLAELLTILLPSSANLRLDALEFDPAAPAIMLNVTSTQVQPLCSACQQPATRVHSRYRRSLADLPWADIPIRLQLHVRKFFCANLTCSRCIFTERLPSLVAPSARRTMRLLERQRHLGLALGGTAGARLSRHLASPASRNTLLHFARTTPRPEQPTPRVLGVDDWSQRKGHSYRTILVDIERHRPIELLPDREAATLATWLAAHPGVEIICRDRAGAYAEGARTGAPNALQVADRFHLLRNLYDALRRVLEQHASLLVSLGGAQTIDMTSEECAIANAGCTNSPMDLLHIVPPEAPSARMLEQASRRRGQRLARYEQVRQLHKAGWTLSAIAQQMDMDRNTVRKYVSAPSFPERQPRTPRSSVLDPYTPYLVQRWNEGCRTGTELWRDLEQQGYTGKRVTVFRYVRRLRDAHGLPPKKRKLTEMRKVVEQRRLSTTPRSLAWLVLRRSEKLDEAEQQLVAQLRELHPELDEAVTLSQEFARLIRERGASELDAWLERATTSSLAPFRGFAMGIRRDYSAVAAGLSEEWSSGQVEGQVNRLKAIKRSMFGRAKLDLLEQRVLYAA